MTKQQRHETNKERAYCTVRIPPGGLISSYRDYYTGGTGASIELASWQW